MMCALSKTFRTLRLATWVSYNIKVRHTQQENTVYDQLHTKLVRLIIKIVINYKL